MKDYTFSQQYALIGLDGLDCGYHSYAKHATLRALTMAIFLESILPNLESMDASTLKQELTQMVKHVRFLTRKEFKALEEDYSKLLTADGTLEILPALISCDINYYTSGIEINQYRCTLDTYHSITEGVRAEILEEGSVSIESICLLWLFRESGCIHDIFSRVEQDLMEQRMVALTTSNEVYKVLWETDFQNPFETAVIKYSVWKKEVFKDPLWQGVNMAFPYLNRRQAVYVDFVIWGTTVGERRMAMISFLQEKGHYVDETRNSSETLIKIDHGYYRVFPQVRVYNHVPVQGAYLLPVYR